jgi:hypothetical protein
MPLSRSFFEKVFEVGSVLAGLCILGSCAAGGFATSGTSGAVLAGIGGLVCAILLVGVVFLITRTSADVRAIREQLDRSQPLDDSTTGRPDDHSKP